MVNVKGGKHYKKGKRQTHEKKKQSEIPLANKSELSYAQVRNKLGGNRIEIDCLDNKIRQCIIPGSFIKKVWINKGDIILIQLSDMNEKECYVLYKYDVSEVQYLKTLIDLRFELSSNNMSTDDNIVFGDEYNKKNEEFKEEEFDDIISSVNKINQNNKNTKITKSKESIKESIKDFDIVQNMSSDISKLELTKSDITKNKNNKQYKDVKQDVKYKEMFFDDTELNIDDI
jgi:translation initiation factor 1A